MSDAPLLQATALAFAYPGGPTLFSGLDLALAPGEIVAVLGPNGCGKSTLLEVLLQLHRPTAGTLACAGTAGFVPQFFAPSFAYSVFDIVLMGRAAHVGTFSVPRPHDQSQAMAALRALELEHLAATRFSTLSGGQQQLVLIARAIATESPVMLLDEPTAALDLHNQNKVLNLLRRLARERALGIVFSTHQPVHALAVADRTLLMHHPVPLCGPSNEVLTADKLSALFCIDMLRHTVHHPARPFDSIVPVYDTQVRG